MKKLSLMDVLEGIEDTRRPRSVMHPLHEALIIMLLAVICGATSYAKVEMFGVNKREWLGTFLELECGMPDACAFRNAIRETDTEKLHALFCKWMKSVVATLTGVVAIDGKQARGTKDATKRPPHVVSAFSHEYGLFMGQHHVCHLLPCVAVSLFQLGKDLIFNADGFSFPAATDCKEP